jgi:hypothetical protein
MAALLSWGICYQAERTYVTASIVNVSLLSARAVFHLKDVCACPPAWLVACGSKGVSVYLLVIRGFARPAKLRMTNNKEEKHRGS